MDTDPGVITSNGIIRKTPGGLNRDGADHEALRWNGLEHHGLQYGKFYQSTPMFFTAEGHNLWLGDMYRGGSLFLVSSGPSTKDMDLSGLDQPGIVTMGLNNSPRRHRPNLWSCVDSPSSFLRSVWLDPRIQKFIPICSADKPIFDNDSIIERDANGNVILDKDGKAILHDDKAKFMYREGNQPLRVRDCPNVVYYRRNEHFRANQFLWEDTINWGNHGDLGGGRSIFIVTLRLAYLLGFRKFYLLGVDFNMSPDQKYSFPQDRSPSSIRGNNSSYEIITKRCEELKPIFDKEGYEVYNCNPNSALKVFPHVPLAEAIDRTLKEYWHGGTPIDTKRENTEGLYDRDDRAKKNAEGKIQKQLDGNQAKDVAAVKEAGKKALAKLGVEHPVKVAQPQGERRAYTMEECMEVKARLDAARGLLEKRKADTKDWLTKEPKDGDDTALRQWVEELKIMQSAEEETRVLFRTIEDEKRWKHGEDIRWGLWDPNKVEV
jgi:hypothetical protein